MNRVRIATRGSALALAQSGWVAERIAAALGVETELVPVRTTGDRIQDRSLAKVGGKGLFVKEVEEALLEGRADLAVHSAKDLPPETAPGLALAAFPERADFRDALVTRSEGAHTLAELPRRARIGTGSARRASQLLAYRSDYEVLPLRGNVDTRLRKIEEDGLHAVILAAAGLERLGLAGRIHERIETRIMLPSAGQGTLALETREGDALQDSLRALDHGPTRLCLLAERSFVAGLSGDCHAPIAALAEVGSDGRLRLRGRVLSHDGDRDVTADASGSPSEAEALGRGAAEEVLGRGADALLAAAREAALA